MARIGIDATFVSPAGKGHSRTQLRSLQALAALGLPHELVAFVRTQEAAALVGECGVRCELVDHRLTLMWEQLSVPRAVRRLRLDAFLTLTDRLPLRRSCRYLTWLFEVPTHRIEQNRLDRAGPYQRASDLVTLALWKRSLRAAELVLTGSRATADELALALPGVSGKLRVVYPGLDGSFSPGLGSVRRGRYVMHIATSDPRDNTEAALRAWALALPRLREPVRLVLPGGLGRREPAMLEEITRLGIADSVEILGRVSDEELVELYRGAEAYVDPTLFEGFGYQVLEAMGCGAPVIASDVTSVPEIVLDAGLLCDPSSPQQFADALVKVLDDPQLAAELRRRGLARAAEFTWARTGASLAGALEEVLADAS